MKTFLRTFTQKTGPQIPQTSLQLKTFGEYFQPSSIKDYKDPEPKTLVHLKRRLCQAWKAVTPDTLNNLINSVPGRMQDVIKLKGNTVRWCSNHDNKVGLYCICLNGILLKKCC